MIGNDLQLRVYELDFNQVIRIVIVPASYAKSINKKYSDVITAFKRKDSQIQKVIFNKQIVKRERGFLFTSK
jgi:hypothetical protein